MVVPRGAGLEVCRDSACELLQPQDRRLPRALALDPRATIAALVPVRRDIR